MLFKRKLSEIRLLKNSYTYEACRAILQHVYEGRSSGFSGNIKAPLKYIYVQHSALSYKECRGTMEKQII